MPSPLSGSATTSAYAQSATQDTQPLLYGRHWSSETNLGDGNTYISYSFIGENGTFSQSNNDYGSSREEDFFAGALSIDQQQLIRAMFDRIEAIANVRFQEISETQSNVGTIRFGWTSDPSLGDDVARTYSPGTGAKSGDIWLNNEYRDEFRFDFEESTIEGEIIGTLYKQILFSLGLKQPDQTSSFNTTTNDLDNYEFHDTLLTYDPSVEGVRFTMGEPGDLLPLDIFALQTLYGANNSLTAGNNEYELNTGDAFYLTTLHDTGGNDTVYLPDDYNYIIRLEPGSVSEVVTNINDVDGTIFPFAVSTPGSYIENLIASPNDDFLIGSSRSEAIDGNYGNDTILGEGAADRLLGDFGDDLIFGGDGNDFITGGQGRDTVIAGDGDDRVFAGPSDDFDSSGSDLYYGGAGNDTLGGGPGDDLILGDQTRHGSFASGSDLIYGGSGNDEIVTGTVDLNIGGISLESLVRDTHSNAVWSGSGNDTIYGGDAADQLGGGLGDDLIYAGAGNDRIFGGKDEANDTLHGENGNDMIFASLGNDQVYGGNGSDTLFGGKGNDRVDGGRGNDVLYGGADNDTIYGEIGQDTLYGGLGDDKIMGESGYDSLKGGDGQDTLFGGDGNDTIYGEDGNDRISGNAGDDIIHGDQGNDYLVGGEGFNILYGGSGNDTIIGGGGNGRLIGDDGDDVLVSYTGNNLIAPGEGADKIFFAQDHGIDTIIDFSVAEDLIDLRDTGYTLSNINEVVFRSEESNGMLIINTGPDSLIQFNNLSFDDLMNINFIFS